MLKTITEEMVDDINYTLESEYAFKIKLVKDDIANTGKIVLKNDNGLDTYSIYLTDAVYNEIEDIIYKYYHCKTQWNNTKTIFWLTEEK